MAELRSLHVGAPTPRRSVIAEFQAAFEPVAKTTNGYVKIQGENANDHERDGARASGVTPSSRSSPASEPDGVDAVVPLMSRPYTGSTTIS